MYKIPSSVDVRALEALEMVDWIVSNWIALYEFPFKDGMRLLILKLVRDVVDHFEITPSQLIPNVLRILMALECLSM